MKLNRALPLYFLLLSLLPMAFVGWLSFRSGRSAIESNVFNHLQATNRLKQREFDRWINDAALYLRSQAQRPLVRQYAAVLLSAHKDGADFQAAYDNLLNNHFLPLLADKSFYLEFSILSPQDGRILLSTEPGLVGKYRENRAYFLEGQKGTYIDRLNYEISDNAVVQYVSTPILDSDGALIAVLSGHADLQQMGEIIEDRSQVSDTEDTYLVNAFNFFVTEPRFGQDYSLKKAVHTSAVEACLKGASGQGVYADYRGESVLGAYLWMPARELCILTEIDQAEALAPVVELRNILMGTAAGVALAAGLAAVFYARTITNPVNQLVAGAQAIGGGDLAQRITLRARNELADLAAAFNTMAAGLQRSLQQTAHNQDMLFSLSQAAQAVQRARSPDEIYHIVGEQVHRLGYNALIFMLDDTDRHLVIRHMTFDPGMIQAAEKMIGISGIGHRFPIPPGGEYESLMASREASFHPQAGAALAEALPARLRESAGAITGHLGMKQTIFAPLIVGGRPAGLLGFTGEGLSEDDMPAVNAFANQTAIALENTLLAEEIEQYAHSLEQRVEERTRELQAARVAALNMMEDAQEARQLAEEAHLQAELARRQEEISRRKAENTSQALERSNKELEQYAYVASHDLQEPLRMVASYLQLLERRYKEQLDEDAQEFIQYAVNGATRMKGLINDLLEYSRINTRGGDLVPIKSQEALDTAMANLKYTIEEQEAAISHVELPAVLADPGQLTQLFQNLIGNAIKFRGPERPNIHIGLETQNGEWIFSVRDNGIGLDTQYAERIFLIFQRLHTRSQYEGTGIGLAICKRIVERHGGRIWVESQPGRGATFFFTMPRPPQAAETGAAPPLGA